MIRAAILAFAASLALAVPAHAGYVFDPADLPESFECDEEWDAARCARERTHEAWWSRYREQYDDWYFELTHRPSLFFGDYRSEYSPDQEDFSPLDMGQNIVDASYGRSLRRFSSGRTFAVAVKCSRSAWETTEDGKSVQVRDWRKSCEPVVRMLRVKPLAR